MGQQLIAKMMLLASAFVSITIVTGSRNMPSASVLISLFHPGVFCVANSSVESAALERGLALACGTAGAANCSAIQPGQPCFVANNLAGLASYAYNDYYHQTQEATCDFNHTAVLTTTNPSHDSCIFAGSALIPTRRAPMPPESGNGVLRAEVISFSSIVASLILLTCFDL